MNPGGPGGSGLDAAWGLRSGMPADMLRAYDIVSWDPRGIGASTPPIDCGADPDVDSPEFMADCALHTGDLAGYLSGPYSAADLEAIHEALGEDRLDYLGYSYGTIIGATFAADHPDQVGHFVLDGATDPLVGGPDGTTDGGFPYYADDGVDAALDRFIELCDQSDACLTDEDTRSVLDELRAGAEALPTDDFAGEPNAVDPDTFDGLIRSALTYRRRLAAPGDGTRRCPRRGRVGPCCLRRRRRDAAPGGRGSRSVSRAVVPGRQPGDLLRRLRNPGRGVGLL